MHLHIFSFDEHGHRMSKHVDGHGGITVNVGKFYNINPITVASENYNKMLRRQNIALN